MTDETQVAEEATAEVVPVEAEQPQPPEEAQSTEGQVENQPAEDEEESEDGDKLSRSARRRANQKAERAQMQNDLQAAQRDAQKALEDKERAEAEVERLKARNRPAPKQEDYGNDYDAFQAATTAHAAAQMLGSDRIEDSEYTLKERQRVADEAAARRAEVASRNWQMQVMDAKERYADFEAVAQSNDVPITREMASDIAMSEVGADVAYFLGMNRDKAREIAVMPPEAQSGAMKALSMMVSQQLPKPKTQSKAPQPVNPVTPKAAGTKDPADMSMAEYKKARAEGKI